MLVRWVHVLLLEMVSRDVNVDWDNKEVSRMEPREL